MRCRRWLFALYWSVLSVPLSLLLFIAIVAVDARLVLLLLLSFMVLELIRAVILPLDCVVDAVE